MFKLTYAHRGVYRVEFFEKNEEVNKAVCEFLLSHRPSFWVTVTVVNEVTGKKTVCYRSVVGNRIVAKVKD